MIHLRSVADLDQVLAEKKRPVILFKHSTQCPVSAAADDEYRTFVDRNPEAAVFTHLDLLAHRDVSNAIARRLDVRHESPQAIVLRGSQIVAVLNHDEITANALTALLGG